MARSKSKAPRQHVFRNKLLLNQWLLSLFGIDPLIEHQVNARGLRPFHRLAEPLRDPRVEGLDTDNIHTFYHALVQSDFFNSERCSLRKEHVLHYEENIVRHTQTINAKRSRKVVWKYYQWLTLLFVEIYLDRFFGNRESLLGDINAYVERFNPDSRHISDYIQELQWLNPKRQTVMVTTFIRPLLSWGRRDQASLTPRMASAPVFRPGAHISLRNESLPGVDIWLQKRCGAAPLGLSPLPRGTQKSVIH